MRYVRVVIKAQVDSHSVSAAHANLEDEWEDEDDTFLREDKVYAKWWKSVDDRCAIKYMQDPIREVRYYHLTGTGVEKHVALIREGLPTYEHGEIEAMMASARTPGEKIVAIYHAAASAPAEADPAILDFLTRSLTDEDPAVRRTAVDAALVALWPDLRGPLERVAAEDADVNVQAFARETLATLAKRVWADDVEDFDFEPLPPDKKRVIRLTGVGDDWYEAAHRKRPARPLATLAQPGHPNVATAPAPVATPRPEFDRPEWLVELMRQGDWHGIRWDTAEQIQAAAGQTTEFTTPALMTLSDSHLSKNRALWKSMVRVGEGPVYTDRVGRTEPSVLYVNRRHPEGLLLALGPLQPPSLWVPAGRTRAELDATAAAYFFPGVPAPPELPFQGRLFLATQSMLAGEFEELERRVERSPFTDMLPWGSSQPTDPYPERVTLGRIAPHDLRRFLAKDPNGLPQTNIRTRYSRSIIQLIDWENAYFADLFFRPIAPLDWATMYSARFGTDFPPGTPADVMGALSGLVCIGPARIRPQADEAEDPHQRACMLAIIDFIEQARPSAAGGG